MNAPRGLTLLLFGLTACTPPVPGGEREELDPNVGHPDSVLFWTPEQQLAGFPNYDLIFPVRPVPASSQPLALIDVPADFESLRYVVEGDTFDLEGFLEHNHVAGVLILQDTTVLFERYRLGHQPSQPWVSYSVTKSVVSLLVGAAIRDGYISSVQDSVTTYLPSLRGSAYDGVTIENVLQMSSGVEWNEDYTDPDADVSREIGMTALERLANLSQLPRAAEPGSRFNYSTGETHLVGSLVRAAVGNNLATLLEWKIWEPFGMEHDAHWRLVEDGGAEHGGCCLSATLRDYGRLGLYAMRNGRLSSGEETLPAGWMQRSTTPASTYDGYGYSWWLGDDGNFAARGIFGQAIIVRPTERLVIATHGVWPQPVGASFSAHRDAFADAVAAALR